MHEEAQRNIAATLTSLASLRDTGRPNEKMLVGVEGAFSNFDFSAFRAVPDAKLRGAVASHFLASNRIAAPSFLGVSGQDAGLRFCGCGRPSAL